MVKSGSNSICSNMYSTHHCSLVIFWYNHLVLLLIRSILCTYANVYTIFGLMLSPAFESYAEFICLSGTRSGYGSGCICNAKMGTPRASAAVGHNILNTVVKLLSCAFPTNQQKQISFHTTQIYTHTMHSFVSVAQRFSDTSFTNEFLVLCCYVCNTHIDT